MANLDTHCHKWRLDRSTRHIKRVAGLRTIHVILGIQRLHLPSGTNQEFLRALQFHADDNVEITTCNQDDFAIAQALRDLLDISSVDDPVIVITSLKDTNRIPDACSRLLMEFPETSIIWIGAGGNQIRTFQLRIKEETFPRSVKGLIEAIHDCVLNLPPW